MLKLHNHLGVGTDHPGNGLANEIAANPVEAEFDVRESPGPLVETDDTLTPRPLTANEQAGNNILFTLRTTMKYHEQRLPVLFDTWLTTSPVTGTRTRLSRWSVHTAICHPAKTT